MLNTQERLQTYNPWSQPGAGGWPAGYDPERFRRRKWFIDDPSGASAAGRLMTNDSTSNAAYGAALSAPNGTFQPSQILSEGGVPAPRPDYDGSTDRPAVRFADCYNDLFIMYSATIA